MPVGQVTLGTGHAPIYASAQAAAAHYDNTGTAVADVRAGSDVYGIWVAGALRPGVTDTQVRALRGAALSGDWRRINGPLRLVGLLAVNVPGFPIPRAAALVASGGPVSLVAANVTAGGGGYLTSPSSPAVAPLAAVAARHLANAAAAGSTGRRSGARRRGTRGSSRPGADGDLEPAKLHATG